MSRGIAQIFEDNVKRISQAKALEMETLMNLDFKRAVADPYEIDRIAGLLGVEAYILFMEEGDEMPPKRKNMISN